MIEVLGWLWVVEHALLGLALLYLWLKAKGMR